MKQSLTLPALLAIVSFAACGDDDPVATATTAPLTVSFVGTVGDEPLSLESTTYAAPGVADGYRMSRLSFFVSEVELLSDTPDGELGTEGPDVAYVELGPGGEATLRLDDVAVGEYVGMRFNLGLTPEQDAQRPQDFAAGHPLANASEYWVDWGSYIFLKVEGRADTLADGRARFDQSFVYHVGKAAENTRSLTVRAPITVGDEGAATAVEVDVETLLGLRGNDPLSLTGVADHQNTAAARIMDNAGSAFTRMD